MGQNKEEQGSGSSFKAFISYSHADADIVRKLHSQLETYRLPKGIGEISSQNAGPRDLGKIFRDREYLSVAEDLSSSVKTALAQSEVLVVVCSPQAKASQWVEREIQYFRSLHKDRPILAALVEGEPEEAFPSALIEGGVEPLAADLRKQGDGWKLGFLKLVAGIVGVPLDALIQRDSQRQLTRVMAVTGVVGVFALFMMAMAFVANQARNEAQFQQKEAEELVAFMMGDLREDLRGVGRLDVMEDVAKRALAYSERQSEIADLSPDSLGMTALIHQVLGEIELEKKDGDAELVKSSFKRAFELTRSGLEADPGNPTRLFEHGHSAYWVGYQSYLAQDWEKAEAMWSLYNQLSEQLKSIDPTNPEWVTEAAYADSNLCTLELARGDNIEVADEFCRRSLDLFIEAYELRPDHPQSVINVANQFAWIGDIHASREEFEEERVVRLAGEEFTELLLEKDRENRDWQDLWLASQTALAEDEIAAGENTKAHARLLRAAEVAQELVSADPANKTWHTKLQTITKLRGSYVK